MESKLADIGHLIQGAQDGDERAMRELITIHKGLVFTIALRMTNDYHASEDLTQETFIKVFLNIKKVKNAEHFKPWICTITRNVVRDYFRKAKRKRTVSLEEIKEFHGHSNIESTKRSLIIQDALAKLAERDRMLLMLTYFKGLSLREVARAMKMSENNVKVGVHRARKRLRKHLEGYENELLSTR